MKKEIDKIEIDSCLQKICSDKLFEKSPRYQHLITFLMEQALEGNSLKEHIIGMELFKKNYNLDKNDGIVRVYMYNLRKKLKSYYSSRGKNDSIVFNLEKGSYDLKIDLQKDVNPKKILSKKIVGLLLVVILLLSCFTYLIWPKQSLYCWESFFEKDESVTCIMADHLVLYEQFKGYATGLVHPLVQNKSDYDKIIQNKEQLKIADYPLFSQAIPISINHLTKLFTQHEKDLFIAPERDFRYTDARKGNLIYIGQYKTMKTTKELFLKNSLRFKPAREYFVHSINGKEQVLKPSWKQGIHSEYAFVSLMTLENDNKVLFFVSHHDIGVVATVKNFTNREWLEKFYNQIPDKDADFNALFKVTGIQRTDTSCELVDLEIIEK